MADHSRMLKLGSEASGRSESELREHLEASRVSIGLDPAIPGVRLAAELLVRTLRRMPGVITLDPSNVPRGLVDRIVEEAALIDPDRPVKVARTGEFDIAIRLAATGPRGTLRALPDLHGYRLTSGNGELRQRRPASALGSASVAAVVSGEVFKTTAAVKPPRGLHHRTLSFCPVTLTSQPENGPELPASWRLVAMLLALGAIGTGTALILSELPVEGDLDLVDPQRYATENVGTYSLGGVLEGRDKPFKTDVAAAVLRRFETRGWQRFAGDLPELIDAGSLRWPIVMLTGPDSPGARRDAQRVRPDRMIDGGTGGTMVGLHVTADAGQPCMSCLFPETVLEGRNSIEELAALTGLPPEILVRGADILTEHHLASLDADQQALVRPHVGKEICGLASAIGLTDLGSGDFQPSVPFVSLTAAALVVGRLVAQATGVEPAANFVQFDGLAGPRRLTADRRRARPGCECVERAGVIAAVRARRHAQ